MNADRNESVLSDVIAAWPPVGDQVACAEKLEEICVQVTSFLSQTLKARVTACLLCLGEECFCHVSCNVPLQEEIRQSVLEASRKPIGSLAAKIEVEWKFTEVPDGEGEGTRAEIVSGHILSRGEWRGLLLSNEMSGAEETIRTVAALLGPSLTALERLRREARLDPLTGIPNRTAFEETLNRHLRLARRHESPLGILLLDLNRLKTTNDTFGHAAGDAVLRTLVERVRETIRDSDVFCRMGGDEFALLLPETDFAGAEVAAQRISNRLTQGPVVFGSLELPVSADIGISGWKPGYPDPVADEILQEADKDLYRKKAGISKED